MGREQMTMKNIQEAKDPNLPASVAAMKRAAEAARKIAIQTGTNLIVVKDGQLVRIPPEVLQKATPAVHNQD
jgi:hypothetical protein